MAEHLGFIGVGRMGAPMAARLIDAGHKVTIFDTSRAATAPLVARGAVSATSARELAAAVETVSRSGRTALRRAIASGS